MLEKIVQIKNIGRFRDYAAKGDVTFRKLTLVYAENGRGKTTLCAILRSLQTGQTDFIRERKTLATTDPAFVHLRLNNANYQFTNGAWTERFRDGFVKPPIEAGFLELMIPNFTSSREKVLNEHVGGNRK